MPKFVDHDARRRELARAAWRVVARDGLDGLTTRAVAKEAGWSTGVLAHYFDSRSHLVLAAFRLVFDDVMQRMQAALAAEADPAEALIAALLEAAPIAAGPRREAIVWFSFLGLAAGDPVLRDEAQSRYQRWLDLIEQGVDAALGEAPHVQRQTRRLARLLVSHVDGLTVQALFDPTGLPMSDLRTELIGCIRTTLAATAGPGQHLTAGRAEP